LILIERKNMKKQIVLLILSCVLSCAIAGCSSLQVVYRTDNYKQLSIGMSKWEVEDKIGPPLRYLNAVRSSYGYEEMLLYRNRYSEYFALEFINDRLVSANYVYGEEWYPMYSPYDRPSFGKPAFPPNYHPHRPYSPPSEARPGRPPYSGSSQRPNDNARPTAPDRPNNQPQAPDYERSSPTTRTPSNDRPSNERSSSGTSRSSSAEQPATNARSSGENTNRRESSRENSSGNARSSSPDRPDEPGTETPAQENNTRNR
jgi:hypothetical protein